MSNISNVVYLISEQSISSQRMLSWEKTTHSLSLSHAHIHLQFKSAMRRPSYIKQRMENINTRYKSGVYSNLTRNISNHTSDIETFANCINLANSRLTGLSDNPHVTSISDLQRSCERQRFITTISLNGRISSVYHPLLLDRCLGSCLHAPSQSQLCNFTMEMFVFPNCRLALATTGYHCVMILLTDMLSFRAACRGN